jgi:hypothetical protein
MFKDKFFYKLILKMSEYFKNRMLRREYSILTPEDEINLFLGKCPNYALDWGIKHNLKYWSKGHDFITGEYHNTEEYIYPQNTLTINSYELLKKQQNELDKKVSKFILERKKRYLDNQRKKLKEELNDYLKMEYSQ